MENLFCILLMLFAVLLADILGKAIPYLAAPIVQIGLGVLISLLPLSAHFEIDHEMFLFLFVAPLAYYGGMMINKKSLWKMRGSVANMAVVLVVISGALVGFLLHALIPAVSLFTAFVLMASLGPTDHIAVDAVERHSHIPERLMELMKGESVFGEVTSVVLFQIGLTILAAQQLSPGDIPLQFLWLLLGGIVVGFVPSFVKVLVIHWLCAVGIKTWTIHVLFGILYPIFLFLFAEELKVSGVVAIFVAGIVSSLEYKREHPDYVHLAESTQHIWQLLSYSLDGMVFVYLGMEVLHLGEALFSEHFIVPIWQIFLAIGLMSLALFLIRFLWGLLTLPKYTYTDPEHSIPRPKAALEFSMSGARGAITMATVSTIPVFVDVGVHFPNRELLLIVAMGVIICSVLVSYILLPIVAPHPKKEGSKRPPETVEIEILQKVIAELEREVKPESRSETALILSSYRERLHRLQMEVNPSIDPLERTLAKDILQWKQENIQNMIAKHTIPADTFAYFKAALKESDTYKKNAVFGEMRHYLNKARTYLKGQAETQHREAAKTFQQIFLSNTEYVIAKLKEEQAKNPAPIYQIAIDGYEGMRDAMTIEAPDGTHLIEPLDEDILYELTCKALLMETDIVQDCYEHGDLSYGAMRELKRQITVKELQVD